MVSVANLSLEKKLYLSLASMEEKMSCRKVKVRVHHLLKDRNPKTCLILDQAVERLRLRAVKEPAEAKSTKAVNHALFCATPSLQELLFFSSSG